MLATPFNGASVTNTMMTDADFRFQPARTAAGEEIPVTQGNLSEILAGPDREARRTAWESYMDTYLANKNTLASNLSTSIQQNVFMMRARRHNSTLAASLFENNIPVEVFYNLIDTFKRNLPTWHRYWAVRRKALGVEKLEPYDIWAPLTAQNPTIPFEQAVDWICAGLKPMGEEYVQAIRKGCLEERWIDVYPNQGKIIGAVFLRLPGHLSLHRDQLRRHHLQPEHAGARAGPFDALLPDLAEPADDLQQITPFRRRSGFELPPGHGARVPAREQ